MQPAQGTSKARCITLISISLGAALFGESKTATTALWQQLRFFGAKMSIFEMWVHITYLFSTNRFWSH
jgi:hypothetical protein